jgi:hypothetical protein
MVGMHTPSKTETAPDAIATPERRKT